MVIRPKGNVRCNPCVGASVQRHYVCYRTELHDDIRPSSCRKLAIDEPESRTVAPIWR